MHEGLARIGRTMRQAEAKGGARFAHGVTVGAPASGRVEVDVAGRRKSAVVPGHFRKELAAGQDVRISVVGSSWTVEDILSALPTPTVTAPPANANTSGVSPGVNSTGSSGAYDYTIGDNDWNAVRAYTRDIASSTRGIAGDVNELRGDVGGNADDLASLKTTVNDLVSTVNTLRATVAELRTALQNQGRIT